MTGLEVRDLRIAYGGNVAVDGVSLNAQRGVITGLIGPNGAGKTTFFNGCSGLARLTEGQVRLDGVDISHLPPAVRARRGLGRTFQRMELWDGLSVGENIGLGREASLAGRNVLRQLVGRRGDGEAVAEASLQSIKHCGIGHLVDRQAGSLSTGERRLVELARALAGPFTILLLDEPSSGLDRMETARFGEVLAQTVSSRDIGILLVEHDMALVMEVCSYIHVVEFGRQIFEGAPREVQSSHEVRQAYLGEAAG